MKRKSEPQFAVIEGGKSADALMFRNQHSADYYDWFTDSSSVVHYKPGAYYYRSEMVKGLYWDQDYAKEVAFSAFLELETLRDWVNNNLGIIPPRWMVPAAEARAKAGLHPDFTETAQETPHAS